MRPAEPTSGANEQGRTQATPSISLPKGGGAIRGIGEKFSANPVTGTGSMSIPLATSPGRSGFGPQLSLAYDSGSGNGPFGFGWQLALPSIARKTDKGLPRYDDAEESDVFILSGAEDLVPMLTTDGNRHSDHAKAQGYTIHAYRPRIEGAFARIERWTRQIDGDVHWRSLSKDNVLTVFGKDASARIADPHDALRIFRWLICESRDDKGNVVLYGYKHDDAVGADLSRACERNRGDRDDVQRSVNRYLKSIRYGNRRPLLDQTGQRPRFLDDLPSATFDNAGWMFEVAFDYGEHDAIAPKPDDRGAWAYRHDPFSFYRAGFEVRTTRLCRRVLMFHDIPNLPDGEIGYQGLVRSTDFSYSHEREPDSIRDPNYSFLRLATQTAYRRSETGYESASVPPVEFEYSLPIVQDRVELVDGTSLENLPVGVDGTGYQWTDLHSEGIPGILSEQVGSWHYKRNLSPLSDGKVELSKLEKVASKPNTALAGAHAQFMDLAGNGHLDLVMFGGQTPGFYAHDEAEGWAPFQAFASHLNRDLSNPNLRFIDLNGDGHADVLITEDDALIWHASLGETGFGPARRMAQALAEESGPRMVFADASQSVHLADMSGDGLTDLVRIRNGEVCYWPNLGYGRFGAKVAMDLAAQFDRPDQFDQQRILLADIDGSGSTDIVYLHADGVRLYFNQSGNGWSAAQQLKVFPRVDDLVSIALADLLGNGTACLVWSSALPGDTRRQMRYVNLMGAQKPHLLVKTINNLGAETRVHYAPSTKFYLQDKRNGRPWITRLPFPVHVVERVTTFDAISRNRFTTRYAYHHGFFDGQEREFRGFGMVEQWDTEELAALTSDGTLPVASNVDYASHLPPVHTKSWFHTGVYLGRERISAFYAGLLGDRDAGEYYREPGLSNDQAKALLLADSVLPSGLTLEEEREACRALKGSMLRQEIYALDGTPKERHPYTVTEQNFGIRLEQARGANRNAVFLAHPRESISYHYERCFVVDPNDAAPDAPQQRLVFDPRVAHALTLEIDRYGNALKQLAIAYGRRQPDAALPLLVDQHKQTATLITYTENRVTQAIDDVTAYPDDYRVPLQAEARTFELTGFKPEQGRTRFSFDDWTLNQFAALVAAAEIPYEQDVDQVSKQKRLIEHARVLYRPDDMGASRNDPLTLLGLGVLEPSALPGESYKLAYTPGLLAQNFQRDGQPLMPDHASVLGGEGSDRGGYLSSQQLKALGRFPSSDLDDHWWVGSGRVNFSPNTDDTAAQEIAYARGHFFLPQRMRSPFQSDVISTESFITYDAYDLLMLETRDALGNRVTAGERRLDGSIDPSALGNDYRLLQPLRLMDANRNRAQVACDIRGMIVGTAVLGKPEENLGDSLDGFITDLSEAATLDHLTNPLADPNAILVQASTRLVYDLFAYMRSKDQPFPQPAAVYALVRETHAADLQPGERSKVQKSFSYSDGFGREIQKKIQAEPEKIEGAPSTPRWVASGWTIFNNKGKPVRQYEPFFTATHRFEFGVEVGVSPILFYDPLARVIAILNPNHTYQKVVFDPWRQVSWDVNDTVLSDPRTDIDIRGYTARHFRSLSLSSSAPEWQTWHAGRQSGALGVQEQMAATKAAAHANTPSTAYFDTLGRPYLTVADNGPDPTHLDKHVQFIERIDLDIEGNPRTLRDALEQAGDQQGRIIMRYAYDMLGNRIYQLSMEAGARWMLSDVAGNPIRAWDSRGHTFRSEYDQFRRPVRTFVAGDDADIPNQECLTERLVYGEQHPLAELHNLRGKPYLHFDQAGVVVNDACDFKGNPLSTARRLTNATQYRHTIDWQAVDADLVALPADAMTPVDPIALEHLLAARMEAVTYTSKTRYDALNRHVEVTTPHTPLMRPNIIRPTYNEANQVQRVDANLQGARSNGEIIWTPFVNHIDYDAKGQRQRIDYGNGATTHYTYDPLTLRLVHLRTLRDAATFPDDCPKPAIADWPGCQLQNLHYTFDPAGNITHIRDDAQQAIYFKNRRVEPNAEYTYDALYRLIEASGREHLGQAGGAPIPHSHNDSARSGIDWSANDGQAMGRYVERYVYDAVGNFLEMQHHSSDPIQPGWTRRYGYEEASLIESGNDGAALKISNRLSNTRIGSNNAAIERYFHDTHGNITRMPHLGGAYPDANMHWDHRDQLRQVDLGGGGTTYYVYDAAGQRVRKVWEKSSGLREERIYLGGIEIFHRQQGAERLERETLHIMDGEQRIALIETRSLDTAGDDPTPAQLIRYQLGNHLGSSSIELDEAAQLISYEEYTPYGSTAYQAVRSQATAAKRYRYTGMERDEESGLSYHSARYYATWLGKWTSSDPAGFVDGTNLYRFCRNNPLVFMDPDGRKPTLADFKSLILEEILAYEDLLQAQKQLVIAEVELMKYEQEMLDEGFNSKKASRLLKERADAIKANSKSTEEIKSLDEKISKMKTAAGPKGSKLLAKFQDLEDTFAIEKTTLKTEIKGVQALGKRILFSSGSGATGGGGGVATGNGGAGGGSGAATGNGAARGGGAATRGGGNAASEFENTAVVKPAPSATTAPPSKPPPMMSSLTKFKITVGILGIAATFLQGYHWYSTEKEYGYFEPFPGVVIATDPEKPVYVDGNGNVLTDPSMIPRGAIIFDEATGTYCRQNGQFCAPDPMLNVH